MKCPACGSENPDHAEYCNLCMSTIGFECAEYTGPPTNRDDGFKSQYPSSFGEGAPVLPPEEFTKQPSASPVDIGLYGVKSGEQLPDAPQAGADATRPVDIGQYGVRSGHEPHEPPPLARDYGYEEQVVSRRTIRKEAKRLRKERRKG
jgi:hypothetical protein